MNFTKMHGTGNDFVVIESDDMACDWSQLALEMCDRHYGIGADGILLLLPSDVADFRMRIFNADGSESNICGNGLRCVVKYFVDRHLTDAAVKEISVETLAGVRTASVYQVDGKVSRVKIGMGKPGFEAKDIPVNLDSENGEIADVKSMIASSLTVDGYELQLGMVSMGNPHAVHFYREPVSGFPLAQLGPKIEYHKVFPNRTNFEVVRVLDRQQIEARVWERGVGETLACGSGACAITVAARQYGYIDDKVDIKLPGGILELEWDGVGEVFLSGLAEVVFEGQWPDESLC
ncbi:MAG: diaminopimelate epimerase [Dehalococcoidales bacterium]|nr:diaminopimelate epimerase [Dehalococcoidales bacterium]